MAYENSYGAADTNQNIIIENRSRMSVSGVESVISFDENTVIVNTVQGTLYIHGSELHLEKLNLENGEVKVEGQFEGLEYEETALQGGGLFSRLFK